MKKKKQNLGFGITEDPIMKIRRDVERARKGTIYDNPNFLTDSIRNSHKGTNYSGRPRQLSQSERYMLKLTLVIGLFIGVGFLLYNLFNKYTWQFILGFTVVVVLLYKAPSVRKDILKVINNLFKAPARQMTQQRQVKRNDIPLTKQQKDEILIRANYQCEWPPCKNKYNIVPEVHHIVPREMGGSNKKNNLIALCPNHHKQLQSGVLSRSALKDVVRRKNKK